MAEVSTGDPAKRQPWYANRTSVDLLSIALSVVSLLATATLSLWLFYRGEGDVRVARSIEEIDRTYDPEFAVSLARVVDHAYDFLEDPALNGLPPQQRFERFWSDDAIDADMIVVNTRLNSIENCYNSDNCSKAEVLARFPDIVYQAVFFLRDFVFLTDELRRVNQDVGLSGWWLGPDLYGFLADYCASASAAHGGMDLWSEKHERLRAPDAVDIEPCLDPAGMR
jgi:hypothetical protein